MVCKKCQRDWHWNCPGHTWCDCQHRVKPAKPEEEADDAGPRTEIRLDTNLFAAKLTFDERVRLGLIRRERINPRPKIW